MKKRSLKLSCVILMLLFANLTQSLATSLLSNSVDDPDSKSQKAEPTIRQLADKAGILIGVRAYLKDDAQKTLVEREFNTSTRTCYPKSININPGQHDFESFNEGVNWLYERGMKPMHHMLCGPTQYEPAWIKEITSPAVLDSILEERIRSIMLSNDNASKVNVWNVVNEAFDWSGGEKEGKYFGEDMVIWVRLGYEDDKSGLTGDDKVNDRHPVFIRKAFEYANKYAKGKLELRENSCEKPCRKARALYQLVRHLQQSGVRIDGVGLQCHFPLDGKGALNPQGLAYEVSKYRKAGVEVYLTEVDFGRKKLPWNPETAQKQKEEYKKLITVALNEGVSQVHFWGLKDADENWLKDENPLLFDENLNPKPAYYGVREALLEYLKRK